MKSTNLAGSDKEILKEKMLRSLLFFTQIFYMERTGRKFKISQPPGRVSHHIDICTELTNVIRGEDSRLIINIAPRYGKTELLIHFICWALANYPDSNFIYVCYSHTLAKKQTQTIRDIISLPMYKHFFGVEIKADVSAKDNFETTHGGSVYAVGSGGSITGRGAGISNCNRFGGAIIIDDIIKPSEASSNTIREGINDWFYSTLQSRINTQKTPIILSGQRTNENDLPANLLRTGDWNSLILPSLDVHNNPLYPEMHDLPTLLRMKELSPYIFAAHHQQTPLPDGGGIFNPEWFRLEEEMPEILSTFITVDTAETDKSYNDATVFSFWGLYKIQHKYIPTGEYGLIWLDCVEIRIEPKDLDDEFTYFYASCMRFKVKPSLIAIEKKSTATTLLSVLKTYPGLHIVDIKRTKASGSKTARFLEIQPIIAEGFISLLRHDKHVSMCLEHCRKITANGSHRFDDIADTLYDAIKIALIDRILINRMSSNRDYSGLAKSLSSVTRRIDKIKERAYRVQ